MSKTIFFNGNGRVMNLLHKLVRHTSLADWFERMIDCILLDLWACTSNIMKLWLLFLLLSFYHSLLFSLPLSENIKPYENHTKTIGTMIISDFRSESKLVCTFWNNKLVYWVMISSNNNMPKNSKKYALFYIQKVLNLPLFIYFLIY